MITITLLVVVCAVASQAFQVQVGQVYRFRSMRFPGHYIHHRGNHKIFIDRVGSTYLVVPGLAGQGVSFRATNPAGRYIRHRGYKCYLDKPDGTNLFRHDVSFIPQAGLGNLAGSVSFQSVNYRDRYLRSTGRDVKKGPRKFRAGIARVQVRNAAFFKYDATWLPLLVYGTWGAWSKYGACSKTCGGGEQKRTRACTRKPAPYSLCYGAGSETQACNTQACAVNGNWGDWGAYGKCSKSCGGGVQERSRSCDNPAPSSGGSACAGENKETQACNAGGCPVNGNWGDWGAYGACSTTCGAGVQERSRPCNNPAPSNGGSSCGGSSKETKSCNAGKCPVNGKWTPWGSYGKCSKFCGDGVATRTRTCTNPAPSNGGSSCSGKSSETKTCNVEGNQCPGYGWCLNMACQDQNDGDHNIPASSKEDCLDKCRQYPNTKACEWSGKYCTAHTQPVSRGSGDSPAWQKNYSCWVFSKC